MLDIEYLLSSCTLLRDKGAVRVTSLTFDTLAQNFNTARSHTKSHEVMKTSFGVSSVELGTEA